jgi:hypothetical protein
MPLRMFRYRVEGLMGLVPPKYRQNLTLIQEMIFHWCRPFFGTDCAGRHPYDPHCSRGQSEWSRSDRFGSALRGVVGLNGGLERGFVKRIEAWVTLEQISLQGLARAMGWIGDTVGE